MCLPGAGINTLWNNIDKHLGPIIKPNDIIFHMFGTNDSVYERSILSNQLLIQKYIKCLTKIQGLGGRPVVIRPPPKTDPKLNEKLQCLFDELELILADKKPEIPLNSPLWDLNMISKDGVHLRPHGVKFLSNFCANFRYPSNSAQNFAIVRKPKNISIKAVKDQATQTDFESKNSETQTESSVQNSKIESSTQKPLDLQPLNPRKRKFKRTSKNITFFRSNKVFCID